MNFLVSNYNFSIFLQKEYLMTGTQNNIIKKYKREIRQLFPIFTQNEKRFFNDICNTIFNRRNRRTKRCRFSLPFRYGWRNTSQILIPHKIHTFCSGNSYFTHRYNWGIQNKSRLSCIARSTQSLYSSRSYRNYYS